MLCGHSGSPSVSEPLSSLFKKGKASWCGGGWGALLVLVAVPPYMNHRIMRPGVHRKTHKQLLLMVRGSRL